MLVFGDFNTHNKDWLTYSGATNRPSKFSNDITQIVKPPTWIPNFDYHSPAHLDFFLMLAFVLQWLSLHWEILIAWLSRFPLTFCQTKNRMPRFII